MTYGRSSMLQAGTEVNFAQSQSAEEHGQRDTNGGERLL
uniref:Uncharacterized protein n=1 Tax=Anguilla anguilla TaxID=7936 RepID=A0A0E9VQD7_ANGAN